MNKKRLARVIIAAVVTVAILVAIIVGCGPKWGDGSVNANASNTGNSNSAGGSRSSGTGGSGTSDDSSTNYATRASVQLPSYYMEKMVFQRGKRWQSREPSLLHSVEKPLTQRNWLQRFPKVKNHHPRKQKFLKTVISLAIYLSRKQALSHIH